VGGIGRWGEGNSLDFWTALERGEVDAAEIRAVDLLRRTTDSFRFAYYCQTAMLPAMGNVTGRIYMLERGGAALELEDGHVVASWCISIGPHATTIPGTDQVVVLRNFVEGEEIEFMRIGNRTGYHDDIYYFLRHLNITEWLPNLFLEPLLDRESENDDILALEEIRPSDWMYRGDRQAPVIYAHNYQGQAMAYRPWRPRQRPMIEEEILRQMVDQIPDWNEELQEEQIQVHVDEVAMQDLIDVYGDDVVDEVHEALMEWYPPPGLYDPAGLVRRQLPDGRVEDIPADIHCFQEGALYEPLGPVLRQLPGRRMEAFLPVPAGPRLPVMRLFPDGGMEPLR